MNSFTHKIIHRFMFLSLPVLCGCAGQSALVEGGESVTIAEATVDSVVDSGAFIASIDSLLLRPDSGSYVSAIQDVCFSDSCVMVLDMARTVYAFSTADGRLVSKIAKYGRGRGEYVDPKAICANNDTLYVLDFQTRKVLKYDGAMAARGEVSLKFPALDFTVVPGGFLFYNMNAGGDHGQVVYTDLNGRVKGSFLPMKEPAATMTTDKVFTGDGNGNVYFIEPNANTIYRWENGALIPAFALGKGGMGEGKASADGGLRTRLSFVTPKYIVTQYMQGQYMLNNVYDRRTGTSRAGIISTGTRFPFMPQCQGKGKLFGVCRPFDTKANREGHELFLVSYTLN